MSLYLEGATAIEQPFPGIEVLDIGPGLTAEEFAEFATELTIPRHFGMGGCTIAEKPAIQLGERVIAASRTADTPRDPWAPDHHWHADRSYWGEDNQFASVLYAQRLEGEVAATGLIDTTALLQEMKRDEPDLVNDLTGSLAIFSVTRYYEEILPLKGTHAAIQRTLEAKGADTLEAVVVAEAAKYPPKVFPATPIHPFSGERCAMIDDSRLIQLTGLTNLRSREIIDRIRFKYLNLPPQELADRPYYVEHEWEEGQVLIFPQVGNIHRANPSPSGEIRRDTLRLFIA